MENIIYTHSFETPIGNLFAAFLNEKLVILNYFDEKKIELQLKKVKKHFNTDLIEEKEPILLKKELYEYFNNKRKDFSIKYENIGTLFQQDVWSQLNKIPYGETISYKEEAGLLNKPTAFRAVANANAKNMIMILVPCHRVISSSGKLSGYAGGGVANKEFLLNLEKR